MTSAQKQMIYILLTTLSGPALAIVGRLTHMASDDLQLWLNLLAALTAAIGAAWGISSTTASGVVQQASSLPASQAALALSQVSDTAKVLIANAVPGVSGVVIKNTAGNGLAKLAADPTQPNIKSEMQNTIDVKLAT